MCLAKVHIKGTSHIEQNHHKVIYQKLLFHCQCHTMVCPHSRVSQE